MCVPGTIEAVRSHVQHAEQEGVDRGSTGARRCLQAREPRSQRRSRRARWRPGGGVRKQGA